MSNTTGQSTGGTAIRPFRIEFPEEELAELRPHAHRGIRSPQTKDRGPVRARERSLRTGIGVQRADRHQPWWGSPEASTPARNRRSEERRVGKECRSRWSPYH